jgi:hypothetical protein
MIKKLLFLFGIALFLLFINEFIISKKSSDKNLFVVCAVNANSINIEIANAVKYISSYHLTQVKDTMHVDIFTTTLAANFINKSRLTNIVIRDANVNCIYINDIKHQLSKCTPVVTK